MEAMTKYTIWKGFHMCVPRKTQVVRGRTNLQVSILINSSIRYVLPDENGKPDVDQEDLIKLDGLYFFKTLSPFSSKGIFNTRYVTCMLSGRYVPSKDVMELVFYYHDGDKRPIFDLSRRMTIPITDDGVLIEYHVSISGQIFTSKLIQGNDVLEDVKTFNTPVPKWSNRINFYFGGNEKAPNKVSIYKRDTK